METTVNCMTLFNLNSNLYPTSVIVLKLFGEKIAVCADTGASHTIADHYGSEYCVVDLYIEGKVIATGFLVLPDAKGNKTLLGLDFLNAARIVLDVQGGKWHLSGNPRKQYKFFKKTLEDITLSAFELRENEAMSPYRTNPAKKEVLREHIEELLRQNVIEECESPYAAPVVFVPEPNGKGYHQVKVADVDQDKTAFVCAFGTYRCLRTPFGLRNAPATFQRLIDKFRSGLKDVFALSYLDDIIVLSEKFEKYLEDLGKVFERLFIFKLHANRDKCHFACDRGKYLGFWITKDGIEADQEKISAIQKIPVPTNVKEVQSLLQTCSWFRRYAPNFADIARPLSSLTKKKVQWHWGVLSNKNHLRR
ncbi:retrovirus-related Pol polyprotein from transposon 17.6 [Trichonephila clavipes]|nr:retrovirus-related Pol polyprotein from transposon 17.6 [Trichonephila clavipes]